YKDDAFFKMIIDDPTANKSFHVKDDLIWMINSKGDHVLCIPKGTHEGQSIQEIVLNQAHEVLSHFGYQQTLEYARRWYWW
ncbi:hypothetical protein ARMSODRAFT_855758, partial [Armillaria solidipes]